MEVTSKSTKAIKLWNKVARLVQEIIAFSESLPANELYQLKTRLINSAVSVPGNIEDGYRKDKKIDRIRSLIKVNGTLAECRDYLLLIERLRYGNTRYLVDQLDDVSLSISEDFSKSLKGTSSIGIGDN